MGVYAADSLSVQNQNGMIAQQSTTVGGMTKIRFYDYIAPGATQVYSIYGQPNQTTVVLYMAKLSFSVNVNQTWVSPIVPANPEDCQYLVRNERYCKG
jgi:hypothetical protein